jgi:tetratricopeptide (TPR) repeat protein
MAQAADAVALLHSQRPNPIIHRDIKPQNIKITPAGQAVLVDFGIAKLYVPTKGTARIAKAVSVGFSPYEQYAGTTDTRSDVYALGATLYCMLTATVPPDAFSDRLMKGAPLDQPSRLNPQVSPAVDRLVMQAMDMDPRRRFLSALELLQALQANLSGGVTPARSAGAVCPRCGFVSRTGAKFCGRDGTRLGAPAPPVPAPVLSPQLNFEMGNAYARNDQHDLAIQSYRQALAGGLSDLALYHNLGHVYVMAKRPAEAIAILRQGLSRYPKDGDLHYELGRAYAQDDNLMEAAQELEQARSIQPQDVGVRIMLGMVYQSTKRHKQAIAELEQALRLKRDEPIAHFLLAKSYLLTDQFDRAEKSLGEAIRLDRSDADYHYYLGVTCLRKKRADLAIQSLQQAIRLSASHFLAHYFMGEAYLAQDNYQESLRWFQKAAPLEPSDPDPYVGIAICYMHLKRRTNAIAAIRQALAIDPNNQRAMDLLSKL